MTLMGLMRICLLTRTRLVVSWIRAPLLEENKNADPFSESAQQDAAQLGRHLWLELLQLSSKFEGQRVG